MRTGIVSEIVPSGWASIEVKVQRFGLPGTGNYIFHSQRCFLNWAANSDEAEPKVLE